MQVVVQLHTALTLRVFEGVVWPSLAELLARGVQQCVFERFFACVCRLKRTVHCWAVVLVLEWLFLWMMWLVVWMFVFERF